MVVWFYFTFFQFFFLLRCAGFAFFHDFVVTDNYYIFSNPPLDFDPVPFLLGQKVPHQIVTSRDMMIEKRHRSEVK